MPARPTGRDVSVVIPVLDHARTLAEAIESVLGQSEPPAEIVVVDDGSSDGSGDVARAFAPSVRVVRQETAGIGSARNRGIAETSRPILGFLDADDRWMPDKLRRQLSVLGPSVGIVTAWSAQIHDRDWPDALRDGPPRATWFVGPACNSVLVRREVFDRVGDFDLRYRAGEFIDWFGRARDAGVRVTTVDDALVMRRIHDQNHGVRQPAFYRDYLDVVQAALARKRDRVVPP